MRHTAEVVLIQNEEVALNSKKKKSTFTAVMSKYIVTMLSGV